VVQKLLHAFPPDTCQEDFGYAKNCLTVLAHCGSVDRVAQKYHSQLNRFCGVIETHLAARLSEPEIVPEINVDSAIFKTAEHLFAMPTHGDPELLEISSALLRILCSPFGGIDNKAEIDSKIHDISMGNIMRNEHIQMVERLDWGLESSMAFRWRLGSNDNGRLWDEFRNSSQENRFLESEAPSGWASSSPYMELDR
jgi:hypothetical protein